MKRFAPVMHLLGTAQAENRRLKRQVAQQDAVIAVQRENLRMLRADLELVALMARDRAMAIEVIRDNHVINALGEMAKP